MPTDYEKLCSENIRRYGEDIGRIGPMLLAQRYDNRSHFIFELLQNAEDALRRHTTPYLRREVNFKLESNALIFSHFGTPFTEEDVRFICGIGESTPTHEVRMTDIGRFGIGFKSVYAFTDRPEIHSGDEHFAIENYVRPCRLDPISVEVGQTVFRFPFKDSDFNAYNEIEEGLTNLDLSTLIFLREIEQVSWQTDSSQGDYLRETKTALGVETARYTTIIGKLNSSNKFKDATFIVFDRPVFKATQPRNRAGHVEVAYQLDEEKIVPIENAKLSVFFPTIVHTQFGAILQGPFRTTPSRDNIPHDDSWNKYLITELAVLVPESIRHLKTLNKLNAQTLEALPIQRTRFNSEPLFKPIFDAVLSALKNEPLIPCNNESYCAAQYVRLGRTAEIRALFSPLQLGALHSTVVPLAWVIDGVTRDRTPILREYLINELGIPEIEPTAILSRLNKQFLETQPVDWLIKLYEFMANHESTWRTTNLLERPIIRLSDDSHVAPLENGRPQAYLPSPSGSDFPTIHPSFTKSVSVLDFFKHIGLSEPDLVDDVITNLLPRFSDEDFPATPVDYVNAIARIHAAASTNFSDKKDRLLETLRTTPFVYAVNVEGTRKRVCPQDAYIHTERLFQLFSGIDDIWFIEKNVGEIPNELHRNLLRACGGNEYLLPIKIPSQFTNAELVKMRTDAKCPSISGYNKQTIIDFTLRDLDKILTHLPALESGDKVNRASLLWDALLDVQRYRGESYFSGEYSWFYHTRRQHFFDAAFVRHLRLTPWIPKSDGTLAVPSEVVFENFSPAWPSHPFLLSKLPFKPRAEVELAQLTGLDPDLIDLLKSQGITSRQQLEKLLNIPDNADRGINTESTPTTPRVSLNSSYVDSKELSESVTNPVKEYVAGARHKSGFTQGDTSANTYIDGDRGYDQPRPNPSAYRNVFHTYVAVSPEDNPSDTEGLDQATRMLIEQQAITYILEKESSLQTTPAGNPGFDLFEGQSLETPTRIIEVKARSGAWTGPVALSAKQFRMAQQFGDKYWLYVVESTNDPSKIKLHRIQDPAGKAHYFAFDRGWAALTVDALNTASHL